jgi:hypothetical protein
MGKITVVDYHASARNWKYMYLRVTFRTLDLGPWTSDSSAVG